MATEVKRNSIGSRQNPFDGPIPGQSLTKAPGSSKMEQAPKFTDISEAAEYVFDSITKPKNVAKLVALFQNGMPAEAYARSVAMAGASEGKWTPDVGLLIAPVIQAQAVAVAKKAGMKDSEIKVANPRPQDADFFAELGDPREKMNKGTSTEDLSEVDPKEFKGVFGEV